MRVLLAIALAAALAAPGCGVRMFSGKKQKGVTQTTVPPQSEAVSAHGPFHAAGSATMSPAQCGSQTGRPCARARAAVGMPYHFDVNPNAVQGPVGTAPGPYPGVAGAGKTRAMPLQASARKPSEQLPRLENVDLDVIGRQPAKGEHRF